MFKKLIISIVILAISTGAVARDITVIFTDGSKHEYNNTPDNVTSSQVKDRAERDFPNKVIVHIAGTPIDQPTTASETSFWDNPVVQGVITVVGVVALFAVAASIAKGGGSSGRCDYTYQTAKDGSNCGGRAASVRPGGR
jgi:hypothetical protein